MMRGISIFAFFTLSTIMVIVLQPGPRDDFANQQNPEALLEASRNDVQVLNKPQTAAKLTVPDEVITKLKAGAQPERAVRPAKPSSGEASGSLVKLQAALNASLNTDVVVSDAVNSAPSTQRKPLRAQTTVQAIAPELRDMSWQTLNALNNIGHVSKAPGQKGSLLNSIVRRSMGHVDGTQVITPTPSARLTAPTKPVNAVVKTPVQRATRQRVAATSSSNSYVVTSGDTLALIAIKLYGSALATDRLLAENPTLRQNPNALRIGQMLTYSFP